MLEKDWREGPVAKKYLGDSRGLLAICLMLLELGDVLGVVKLAEYVKCCCLFVPWPRYVKLGSVGDEF